MNRIYSNAPITEAIIDIQVKPTEATSMEALLELQASESARYPERNPLVMASVMLENPNEPGDLITQASKEQRGWAFFSPDKLQIWQARRDGFTFARLAPYQSWEPFRTEARRLWTATHPIFGTAELTRVAVRYINRLELPLPMSDFKDYLRTVPEVSSDLPQGLTNFFLQAQIPLDEAGVMATINQTILPPLSPEAALTTVAVLLDIDVFMAAGPSESDDHLWETFELLRERKDKVFEACITDRTRELIN